MSPLARVNPRAIGQIAGYLDRLDDPKAAAELAAFTRDALPAKTWRDFHRLLGFAEALVLDQESGAAIYVYQELIASYKNVPPLVAMQFRDTARLQLELR